MINGGIDWFEVSDKECGVDFGFVVVVDFEDGKIVWVIFVELDMV